MELDRFQNLEIILVCGLPGSGKSHFARTHFLQSGRKRVNRKEIRRLLFEMTNFGQKWSEKDFAASDEFLVKHVERKIVEHLLQNHQKLLIDNTSVSRESRKGYLSIAHQHGKEHRGHLPRHPRASLHGAQQVPGGFPARDGHLPAWPKRSCPRYPRATGTSSSIDLLRRGWRRRRRGFSPLISETGARSRLRCGGSPMACREEPCSPPRG